MLIRQFVAVTILLGVLLAACQAQLATPTVDPAPGTGHPVSVAGGAYTDLTPAALAEMLTNKNFLFANTHIPYEGELEQTDAFIAFEENGRQRIGEYPADANAKIVLFCRTGRMSSIVAEELVKAGYTDVSNLEGGMIAWEQAGYEVLNK